MLVDVAKEHGLFIIGDEAYREFVYAGEPLQSMGQFADAAENVIVIDTVSKRFSACGARIGCLITRNRELMAHAMKYAQCRLSVPHPGPGGRRCPVRRGPGVFRRRPGGV